jgi:hypothetical protein
MKKFAAVLLAIAFVGIETPNALGDGQSCQLQQAASVGMITDSRGRVSIPVSIQGHDKTLLLSTESVVTGITARTATELGLQLHSSYWSSLTIGGKTLNQSARGVQFRLGNLAADNMELLVFPDNAVPFEDAGVLGADVMHSYDDELDFRNAQFKLFSQNHCKGQVVYWTHEAFAVVPFALDGEHRISVPVQLDGKDFTAVLLTASPNSFMSLDLARETFGWNDKTPGLKSPDAPGSPNSTFPFKALTFEGVTVSNPAIRMQPDSNVETAFGEKRSILLGLDVLRQMHIFIAYSEQKLYLTGASAK